MPQKSFWPAITSSALRDVFLMGLLTFLFVYTYFIYLVRVGFAEKISRDVSPERMNRFLLAQLIVMLAVCLICSAVGFFFSRRYGLAGLGDFQSLKKSLPWIFGIVAVGAPAAFFLYDRSFHVLAPGYYPTKWTWALAVAFSTAFSGEIIARFGMMTIFMGIFRNFKLANIAQSLFVTALAIRSLYLADHPFGLNYITMIGLVFSFAGSLAAGWIYYRYGILSVILCHFLFELRILAFVRF